MCMSIYFYVYNEIYMKHMYVLKFFSPHIKCTYSFEYFIYTHLY